MAQKILYTADIHGNEVQYRKLVGYARGSSADVIVIGGDIAPKNFPGSTFVHGQRDFLQNKLPEFLRAVKQSLPQSRVFLMMGNDDCASNLDVLADLETQGLCENIHGKRIKLSDTLDLVGYSFVPITPFGLKDWEKFDLTKMPLRHILAYNSRDRNFEGCKSTSEGLVSFKFGNDKTDSIERDLNGIVYQENPSRTVYVIHTPPNKTNLDRIVTGDHVGSFAVRQFIERVQPHLTLHGHIHETVTVSEKFKDKIGNTICLSPGNHNVGENLALLVVNLVEPEKTERIVI